MKIVVVASLAYSLVNFRGSLLSAMVDAGHEVVACAPDHDRDVIARLTARGVGFRRIAMNRVGTSIFGDLRTLISIFALVRREKPDILLAYTQKPIIYSGIAMRLSSWLGGHGRFFPMVTGLGHVYSDACRSQAFRRFVSFLYRIGVARASTLFVFNGADRQEMIDHGIMRPDQKVLQLPGSGVDIRSFSAWPVPEGPPGFLLVARLMRNKGLAEFAEAARILRPDWPDARFQILGPPDPGPMGVPWAEIDRWRTEGLVEYLGETRHVAPYLARAGVFVLPSYYREGLPRTILEAMATGRPVITTDMPGCREPIRPGENGYLVPPRDANALAAAMERFLRDPTLAQRMGSCSRRIAEETYAVEKVNDLLLSAMGLRPGDASPAPHPDARPAVKPGGYLKVRRGIDCMVAVAAGMALLPIALLTAMMVRLFMGAPIFFTQERSGLGGRNFRMMKFRTMTDRRDADGLLLDDAARLTAIGRILRRLRLDELPQLWNVVRGEMALIGPRPLLPGTRILEGEEGARRSSVRPGLTGWAQVNGNALLSEKDKLEDDLFYVDHAGFALDFQIILRTIGVLLWGERIDPARMRRDYASDYRRRG